MGIGGWGDGCYSAIVNRQRKQTNRKSPRYVFNVETVSGRVALSLT